MSPTLATRTTPRGPPGNPSRKRQANFEPGRESMPAHPFRVAGLRTFILVAAAMLACGQSLPLEPLHESGASVTGAFEGWFQNPDGSYSLLLGYYNRNQRQELDIPIGPDNRMEPGGPDRGQPTHFLPGRQWGLFVVNVPAGFGANKIDRKSTRLNSSHLGIS